MRLLLVEDSARISKSLCEGLRRYGFAVDAAFDGRTGLAFGLANAYDVMILDIMLPELDGLSLLRELRDAGRNHPVLILSARGHVADRVQGLELGADDYLAKPFSFDELLARVKALVRRRYEQRNPVLAIGSLAINTALHTAVCAGTSLMLTPHEMAILELLALRRGQVVTFAVLLDRLYDANAEVSRNALEAHISALRRKLREAEAGDPIKTRRGFGYYIEA